VRFQMSYPQPNQQFLRWFNICLGRQTDEGAGLFEEGTKRWFPRSQSCSATHRAGGMAGGAPLRTRGRRPRPTPRSSRAGVGHTD